jgi:hypothetical protein
VLLAVCLLAALSLLSGKLYIIELRCFYENNLETDILGSMAHLYVADFMLCADPCDG